MKLKIVFALVLAFSSIASQAQQDDAVHLQAVSSMLSAVQRPEATLAGMEKIAASSSPARQFAQHVRAHTTKEEVLRKLVPVFVPLISVEGAHQIAAAYRTPQGQKAAAYTLAMEAGPSAAVPSRTFSERDLQLIGVFNRTAPAKALAALDLRAAPALAAALKLWIEEYQDALFQHAQDAVAEHDAKYDVQAEAAPLPFSPVKLNITYIDDWIDLLAARIFRRAHAEWRLGRDLKALGIHDILTPATLASAQGNAGSLVALDKIEVRYAAHFSELALIEKDFAENAGKITMPSGATFAHDAQEGLALQLATTARYAENQRAILAAMRSVVAFVASRQGQFKSENGVLTASNGSDLATVGTLQARLQREQDARDAIDAELAKQRAEQLAPASTIPR